MASGMPSRSGASFHAPARPSVVANSRDCHCAPAPFPGACAQQPIACCAHAPGLCDRAGAHVLGPDGRRNADSRVRRERSSPVRIPRGRRGHGAIRARHTRPRPPGVRTLRGCASHQRDEHPPNERCLRNTCEGERHGCLRLRHVDGCADRFSPVPRGACCAVRRRLPSGIDSR